MIDLGAPPAERPRLVMLRALGLGDFLTGVPAMRALADAFPDHLRILAAPAALAPLGGLSGAVHALAPTGPLEPLDERLHFCNLGVNLHGRGPESHRVLLGARPDRLIAWAHPAIPATGAMPRWAYDEHEVFRWCRLLAETGIPADPARLDLAVPDDALPDELRAHWNEGEIVEILGVVSLFGFLNRWNDSMGTTLEAGAVAAGRQHLSGRGWSPGKHV